MPDAAVKMRGVRLRLSNQPGFRRRRRAAPLRLFLLLRNAFLFFFFFRARPFFFFFQARARFLAALLLSEYLFLTSKQQRHTFLEGRFNPEVPDAAVKVRGVRLRLSNQPMFRRTRWAATQAWDLQGSRLHA